ncbi:MAG: PTS lactose/cellobiose transporter subunit IIA [Mycoplasmataceae bacterium]|jgi:PTS system cellobiose-specific IIA component|nr:PTS lactose/cellobiose transporter subunit IIA [Mycoplasmataceae bacterium]
MIDFEKVSFKVIAASGEAKSKAMEAIQFAKAKQFLEAKKSLEQAEQFMIDAEREHMEVVQAEANGDKLQLTALFMHAEDQMLTTQTLMLVSKEFVDLYAKLNEK